MVYFIWVIGIMVNLFSIIFGICYGKNIFLLGLFLIYKFYDFIVKDNDMVVFFNVRNMLKMWLNYVIVGWLKLVNYVNWW